jgi:hypothetical protein
VSHPDTCWRVAAIYRCVVRYGKGHDWCLEQMNKLVKRSAEGKVIEGQGFLHLVSIWFRPNGGGISHIDMAREEYAA